MKKNNIMVFEIDERMEDSIRRVDSDISKNYFNWELNSRTNAYQIKYATLNISEEDFNCIVLDENFLENIKINGDFFIGKEEGE